MTIGKCLGMLLLLASIPGLGDGRGGLTAPWCTEQVAALLKALPKEDLQMFPSEGFVRGRPPQAWVWDLPRQERYEELLAYWEEGGHVPRHVAQARLLGKLVGSADKKPAWQTPRDLSFLLWILKNKHPPLSPLGLGTMKSRLEKLISDCSAAHVASFLLSPGEQESLAFGEAMWTRLEQVWKEFGTLVPEAVKSMDLRESMASKYRHTPDRLERSGLPELESRGVTKARDLLDQSVFDLAVAWELDLKHIQTSLRAKSIRALAGHEYNAFSNPLLSSKRISLSDWNSLVKLGVYRYDQVRNSIRAGEIEAKPWLRKMNEEHSFTNREKVFPWKLLKEEIFNLGDLLPLADRQLFQGSAPSGPVWGRRHDLTTATEFPFERARRYSEDAKNSHPDGDATAIRWLLHCLIQSTLRESDFRSVLDNLMIIQWVLSHEDTSCLEDPQGFEEKLSVLLDTYMRKAASRLVYPQGHPSRFANATPPSWADLEVIWKRFEKTLTGPILGSKLNSLHLSSTNLTEEMPAAERTPLFSPASLKILELQGVHDVPSLLTLGIQTLSYFGSQTLREIISSIREVAWNEIDFNELTMPVFNPPKLFAISLTTWNWVYEAFGVQKDPALLSLDCAVGKEMSEHERTEFSAWLQSRLKAEGNSQAAARLWWSFSGVPRPVPARKPALRESKI